MSEPAKSKNMRRRTSAVNGVVSTLAGPAEREPGEANSHTALSRHSVKNMQSTIGNLRVWSFRVGGYQVCEKWLKHRNGCTLDHADLQHYWKIVVALSATIRLMAAVYQTIEAQGGWPGAFWGEAVEGIREFSQGRQTEKPK